VPIRRLVLPLVLGERTPWETLVTQSQYQPQIAKLLMRERTALYSYIFACVRSHADAEDILQNVSVAVGESMDELRDEAGFLRWAREIARRRILAHFRQSKRELPVDPDVAIRLAEAAERCEAARPASARRTALLACLEKLPEQSRRIIVMRYDGSTSDVSEVAGKIDRSVSATYSLIKRIKASLRECVERRIGPEGLR